MTSTQRIKRLIDGLPIDRVPFALWRYFPEVDMDWTKLAKATIRQQERWAFDLIKMMTPNRLWTEQWGGNFSSYDRDVGFYPTSDYVVKQHSDWKKIRPVNPIKGGFGDQIKAMKVIKEYFGPNIPLLATVFSPLCVGIELSGNLVHELLVDDDNDTKEGLHVITSVLADFAQACIEEAHVDGIFYAVQSARKGALTKQQFIDISLPYDFEIFDRIKENTWFNMLHLCKPDLYFDVAALYPVQSVNWFDQGNSGPTIEHAKSSFDGVFVCGLDQEKNSLFVSGTPDEAAKHAIDSMHEAAGTKFMLAPGCCLHLGTPEANIDAVQQVVLDSVRFVQSFKEGKQRG